MAHATRSRGPPTRARNLRSRYAVLLGESHREGRSSDLLARTEIQEQLIDILTVRSRDLCCDLGYSPVPKSPGWNYALCPIYIGGAISCRGQMRISPVLEQSDERVSRNGLTRSASRSLRGWPDIAGREALADRRAHRTGVRSTGEPENAQRPRRDPRPDSVRSRRPGGIAWVKRHRSCANLGTRARRQLETRDDDG